MSVLQSPLLDSGRTSIVADVGLTWRAIFTGTMGVLLVCGLTPFNDMVVVNTAMLGSYFPVAVTSFFLITIVCVNGPLYKFAPKWALSSRELAVAMMMMLVSCCIPTQSMIGSLLPIQVSSFHLGRIDSRYWVNFLDMRLPGWLFPVETIEGGRTDPVMTEFYTRSLDGSVPYRAWMGSMLAWGVLVGGSMLTLASLAWIVRIQWATNERLPFPLTQLQVALLEAPEPGHGLNPMLRSRRFWISLIFVFVFCSMSALHDYQPKYFPRIPRTFDLRDVLTQEPLVHLKESVRRNHVFFTFIGLTYFIQSRSAFSLWFVWLFLQVLNVRQASYGVELTDPARFDQHLGASLVYAGGVFWIGRHHWQKVFRHAIFGRTVDERRRQEMSYRLPFLLMLTGLGIMAGWLLVVGVQWWVAGLILFITVLTHFVTTRVVAETGLPMFRSVTQAQQIASNVPATLVTTRDVFFMNASHMTVAAFTCAHSPMTASIHGIRIMDASEIGQTTGERRKIAGLIVWTVLLGFVVAATSSLWCHYTYTTTMEQTPKLVGEWTLETQAQQMLSRPINAVKEGHWPQRMHDPATQLGIGAGICGLLQLAAWRFAWWPILPVGYIVATGVSMDWAWFSILIGWLAKVMILRFGGPSMFHRARPVFVGMIFGETVAGGIWIVINLVLSANGHAIIPAKFLP